MAKTPKGMQIGAAAAPPRPLMNELMTLYKAGRFADVVAKGKPLLRQYPKVFGLWNLIGAASAQSGQLQAAAEAFEKAAQLNKTSPDPSNNLGNVYRELGLTKEAERAYKKALGINPAYPNALNNLAVLRTEAGDFSEAEKLLQRALRHAPNYVEAHTNLGNLYLAREELHEAKAALQHALTINPNHAEAHYNLGVVFQSLGDGPAAEDAYLRAIRLHPTHVEALRNLGVSLKNRGILDKAIAVTQRALTIAPRHVELLVNLGLTLTEMERLEAAIAAFDQALAVDPDHLPAILGKADALQEGSRLTEAIAILERACQTHPNAIEPAANLGMALMRQGRPVASLALYDQYLVNFPESTNLLLNKGLALAELGLQSDAKAAVLAAMAADPDNDTAAQTLARRSFDDLSEAEIALLQTHLQRRGELINPPSKRYFFAANVERLGREIDRAFDYLIKANAEKKGSVRRSGDQPITKLGHALRDTADWSPAPGKADADGVVPLFIFGPSRSGKSVLEGLLAKSPGVEPQYEALRKLPGAATEVTFDKVFYPEHAELQARGVKLITSTNPHSITDLPVLADGLANAVFVFVRRDTFDIGAEIFANDYAFGNAYAYDAKDIMDYVRSYNALADAYIAKLGPRAVCVPFDAIIERPADVVAQITALSGFRFTLGAKLTLPTTLQHHSIYREQFRAHVQGMEN